MRNMVFLNNVSRETFTQGWSVLKTDFLVVGSGIAGLSFALRVAELGSVIVVTKKEEVDTATNLAQGGIAAVLDPGDSFEDHIDDTIISGAGLCDENVVDIVVKSGPGRIVDLVDQGVRFVRNKKNDNNYDLGREGGHSKRRVAHAYDLTGREIEGALVESVKKHSNIKVLENHTVVDLLIAGEEGTKKCVGAYVLEENGQVVPYLAKVTTLCTGGCGKVYLYTSNPDIATGDGIAMAMRAGAKIANMEFVQFHPSCLYHPKAKNFLISEAVRGEGGILIDKSGVPFMEKYDPRKDLATRDKVARAIDQEMKESGEDNVYLDITHKDFNFLQKRFPTIYTRCMEFGVDMAREPIPVVPAAHYMCGGVLVDTWGKSSLEGLLSLGETACTGLHGGNRLASNSLLEAVVFSKRAADKCKEDWNSIQNIEFTEVDEWRAGEAQPLEEEILINHNWDQIRRTMWNYVGIVRSDKRLALAAKRMNDISEEIENHYTSYFVTPNMIELRNIAFIAHMIISAAKLRKESRGLHYMRDYTQMNDCYKKWSVMVRKSCGKKWELEECKR